MRTSAQGFTLVELLIAIAIMAVLATIGFINFRIFSSSAKLNDGVNNVQSLIRVAQSNGGSSVNCNSSAPLSWGIRFNTSRDATLICQTSSTSNDIKTLQFIDNLANVRIESVTTQPGSTCSIPYPASSFTVNYSVLYSQVSFSSCPNESKVLVIVSYSGGGSTISKTITISKGGGIDAQ